MALNNYANLKQTIQRFSHRTNSNDLNDIIDDLIDLTEDRIDQDLRLRTNEQRATATTSISDRFLALPDSFLEARRVTLISGSRKHKLKYSAPEAIKIESQSGRPNYYTTTSQLEFDRVPDAAYTIEMSYYVRLTPLDDTNTTNDVLTHHPSLYLYGVLSEVFSWAMDEDGFVKYDGLFERKMKKANKQENRGRYGPAPAMRSQGLTP